MAKLAKILDGMTSKHERTRKAVMNNPYNEQREVLYRVARGNIYTVSQEAGDCILQITCLTMRVLYSSALPLITEAQAHLQSTKTPDNSGRGSVSCAQLVFRAKQTAKRKLVRQRHASLLIACHAKAHRKSVCSMPNCHFSSAVSCHKHRRYTAEFLPLISVYRAL